MGGFLSLIAIGTLFLWLSARNFHPLSWLDAFFTATSAVCVTGLTVVDTGAELSRFSQMIVLILIQLGGLGVMTVSTALPILLGQRIGLRQRLLFKGGFGLDRPSGAVRLLFQVLRITLILEGIGVVPLFFAFAKDRSVGEAFYQAIFHSVSAFCNAGFSTFSDSLMGYAETFIVPATIMLLLVLGGLGYPVLSEIGSQIRSRKRFTPYTRLVMVLSLTLGGLGALMLLMLEWDGVLGAMSPGWKIWNSLFHALSPRTAGFNTLPMKGFSPAGVAVTVVLMIIGASPASTGGGLKTTTAGILLATSWSNLRGREDVIVWKRRIPFSVISRALTLFCLYLGTLFLGTLIINLCGEPFITGGFEVVSALGTVGLSLGRTDHMGNASKIVLILLMFWGRVGLLTFMYSLLLDRRPKGRLSYPDTEIPVG